MRQRLVTALLIGLILILGLVLIFNDRGLRATIRFQKVEISQLTEQVGILNKQVEKDNEQYQRLQRISRLKPAVFAEPEALTKDNLFFLDCENSASESARLETYAKVTATLKEGEILKQLCENKESQASIFVTYRPLTTPGRSVGVVIYQLWYFNRDKPVILAEKQEGIYGGCSLIKYWTKTGGIYFECGANGDFGGGFDLIRLNLGNSGREEIAQRCVHFVDRQSCRSSCANSSQCKTNQFCDLETRSCIDRCTKSEDCADGYANSCQPFGPVLGCRGMN